LVALTASHTNPLKAKIRTTGKASMGNALNGSITRPFKNPAIALRDRKKLAYGVHPIVGYEMLNS
jgi:hypothetical protein